MLGRSSNASQRKERGYHSVPSTSKTIPWSFGASTKGVTEVSRGANLNLAGIDIAARERLRKGMEDEMQRYFVERMRGRAS